MLPKPLTFKNGHPVCIPSGQAFDIERTIRQSIFDSEPVTSGTTAEGFPPGVNANVLEIFGFRTPLLSGSVGFLARADDRIVIAEGFEDVAAKHFIIPIDRACNCIQIGKPRKDNVHGIRV